MSTQTRQLSLDEFQRHVDDAILPTHVNGVPWQRGSDTSYEAAAAIAPHKKTLEDEALALFAAAGRRGLADWELSKLGGKTANTGLAPRRCALEDKGLVVKTNQRRPNPATGKRAAVYVLRQYAEGQVA